MSLLLLFSRGVSVALSASPSTIERGVAGQVIVVTMTGATSSSAANWTLSGTGGAVTALSNAGATPHLTLTGPASGSTATLTHVPSGATTTINLIAAPAVSPSSSATSTGATLAANLTGGQTPFTYAWSGTGITFSNSAVANPTATVAAAGTFTASLLVTDANGITASGSTSFTVTQVPTTVVVSPSSATLANTATQQFTAAVADQFGHAIGSPTVTWSYAPGGSVNSTGLVTQAGSTLTATSGGPTGTASVLPGSVATYAAASDVRLNVDRGDGTLGTYDPITGNYTDPGIANVLATHTYKFAGSTLTGTATGGGTIKTIVNISAPIVNDPR